MATPLSEIPVHQPRALVVDDSQIARYILSGQLERLGFQVEVAESAESALREITEPFPDVVFMDQLLPGIDGLEAVSRLRGGSRTAELPIIMYTSQDSDSFAENARAVGADDVYVKSAEESCLREILQRLRLLPERSAAANTNVTPMRRADSAATRKQTLTREKLVRLLEPSLEAHHAKLHQELLGEFAILERYEERMRRDLFARIDRLAKQSSERVANAFEVERADRSRGQRRLAQWSFALAATILLGMVMVTRIALDTATRTDNLRHVTTAAVQAVQDNTQAVMAMRGEMDAQRVVVPIELQSSAPAGDPSGASIGMNDYPPGAAEALVAELQLMGILGPIRVETTAGSFCVEATPDGMQLAVTTAALQDCAPLPVQLSAAGYSQ